VTIRWRPVDDGRLGLVPCGATARGGACRAAAATPATTSRTWCASPQRGQLTLDDAITRCALGGLPVPYLTSPHERLSAALEIDRQ
jgi:hypothetical protein